MVNPDNLEQTEAVLKLRMIFLVQYSWFRLFCYTVVIGYLFAFCCIAELICNKMRSSEINLYYSEMQLELSEIDLN